MAAHPQTPDQQDQITRRAFLQRLGYAAAVTAAVAGIGLLRHDEHGPAIQARPTALSGLGDFALPVFTGKAGRLALVEGLDRVQTVTRGVEALGGMETFIQRGDRVLIKVNAAFATPPTLGATTHPELLTAVARLCFQAGAAQVLVTDNPINDPQTCFRVTGLETAARQTGARLILPQPALFQPVTLPAGRLLQQWPTLAGVFAGIHKVIILSPVKDHQRAGASMTLKNLYGFLGGRRNIFHQDINGIITELAQLLKPTLCILDGTVSMVTNGPTGGSLSDLKETGLMIVSTDPVAADAVGVELLGRRLADIPYIQMAAAAGAGLADPQQLQGVILPAK